MTVPVGPSGPRRASRGVVVGLTALVAVALLCVVVAVLVVHQPDLPLVPLPYRPAG